MELLTSLRNGCPNLFMRLVHEVGSRGAGGRIEGGIYADGFIFTL